MDLTGRLEGISIEYKTRKPIVSLVINENPGSIERFKDKDLKIKIGIGRKGRSLNSNSYFHVLCDKLRQELGISMAACKNNLITSYGQIEYLDEGCPLIYKTNAPPEYIQEREEVHMKYLKTGEDGAHWYKVYRGSHTYDTKEMAVLLEGTIMECKDQGIETATPEELARMAKEWERYRDKQ